MHTISIYESEHADIVTPGTTTGRRTLEGITGIEQELFIPSYFQTMYIIHITNGGGI